MTDSQNINPLERAAKAAALVMGITPGLSVVIECRLAGVYVTATTRSHAVTECVSWLEVDASRLDVLTLLVDTTVALLIKSVLDDGVREPVPVPSDASQ